MPDPLDTPVTFEVDHDAEQGDLVGALAALLLEVVDAKDEATATPPRGRGRQMRHGVSRNGGTHE